MNFIFEDDILLKNFVGTKEINSSDQNRFTTSPLAGRLLSPVYSHKKNGLEVKINR